MKKSLLLLSTCVALPLCAIPKQAILIRHAEKPAEGKHLSLKGEERAKALVPFFLETPELNEHGNPVTIFAQAPKNKHSSVRAIETMKPLARAYHANLNTDYVKKKRLKCAKEILTNKKYDGKTVIACFEHFALEDLAHALGVSPKPSWPNKVWDKVWIIDFDSSGQASLRSIPQKLLYGDSKHVSDEKW